jgi:predicted nucleotidyltransferase
MILQRIQPDPGSLARELATEFSRCPWIAAAYLFGSLARNEGRPDSDLDLGIVLVRRGEATHGEYMKTLEVAGRLEHLSPGGLVDLVLLEEAGPLFAHRVLLDGRLVYEGDRERRIEFEWKTYVRAFDFRPLYERATRGRLRAIRERLRSPPR